MASWRETLDTAILENNWSAAVTCKTKHTLPPQVSTECMYQQEVYRIHVTMCSCVVTYVHVPMCLCVCMELHIHQCCMDMGYT